MVTFLSDTELFGWADPLIVAAIAGLIRVEQLDAEHFIARQRQPSECFWILVDGVAERTVHIDNSHAVQIDVLGRGDACGCAEIALGLPHTASVVSREPVVLGLMERSSYLTLLDLDEALGSVFRQGLIRALSHQLMGTIDTYAAVEAERLSRVEHNSAVDPLWRD
jgi:CRP-like cAMP-binding protein